MTIVAKSLPLMPDLRQLRDDQLQEEIHKLSERYNATRGDARIRTELKRLLLEKKRRQTAALSNTRLCVAIQRYQSKASAGDDKAAKILERLIGERARRCAAANNEDQAHNSVEICAENEPATMRRCKGSPGNRRQPSRFAAGVLFASALALHLAFCEWHLNDTATGAYNIIALSRKPNPLLGPDSRYGSLYDVVNGLFARNSLPAVGAPSPPSPYLSDIAVRTVCHIGTTAGPRADDWVLTATIAGVIIPVSLSVFGCYSLFVGFQRTDRS